MAGGTLGQKFRPRGPVTLKSADLTVKYSPLLDAYVSTYFSFGHQDFYPVRDLFSMTLQSTAQASIPMVYIYIYPTVWLKQ